MKEKIRIKNTGIKNNKKRNKRLIKKKSINRWVFLATDKKKINWNSKAYKFEKDLFYKKMKYWKYVSVKINHKSFRIGDTVEINTNNIGIILSIFRSNSQYFDNVNKDGYFRIQWFYRNLELKKLKNFRKGYFSFFRSKSLCNICLTNIQQKFIKWKYIFCNKNCEKCFFSVPKVFFSEDKNDYFSIKLLTRKVTILCSEKDYKNMLRKNKTYLCLKNIFEKNRLRINWKIFFYEDFKKLIKKEIKFSIIKKRVQLNNKDKIFAQASKCFQLSQIPKSLPCREKEFKKLKRKIKYSMLKKGLGTGFYISGMPGTGKTATIHWVLRYLEDMKKKQKIPDFSILEINALKLQNPQEAYSKLYQHLTGKRHNWLFSINHLEKKDVDFNMREKIVLIIIDELDFLVTKKQKVIYNFFDWPGKKFTNMIVLGIANTIDLPERCQSSLTNRINIDRFEFCPYTQKQIKCILKNRLNLIKCFHNDAIRLASAKVASISGDIRRALQICRYTLNLHKKNLELIPETIKSNNISIGEISYSIQNIFSSNVVESIKGLPLYSKIILVSCVLVQQIDLLFKIMYNKFIQICNTRFIFPIPDDHFVKGECRLLENMQLIRIKSIKDERHSFSIRLLCEIYDILFSLKEDKFLGGLVEKLGKNNLNFH